MFSTIEDVFAAQGRTPKGQQALRAIFRATSATVAETGAEGTSLDAIADRAGLTQAALRHYFATRDELMTAYFIASMRWYQARMAAQFAATDLPPRERMERCIGWHLEFMESVDTLFWLEGSAYWLRRNGHRKVRDEWYRWLAGRLADLLAELHPLLGPRDRERKAYAILTLILGSWITHGRGSSVAPEAGIAEQRQLLVDAAMELAAA